jgi:hypothetical protein
VDRQLVPGAPGGELDFTAERLYVSRPVSILPGIRVEVTVGTSMDAEGYMQVETIWLYHAKKIITQKEPGIFEVRGFFKPSDKGEIIYRCHPLFFSPLTDRRN